MPGDFKGTVYQKKIEWDIIYRPRKKVSVSGSVFIILLKIALCVNGEYDK
jgi:hypothetical protein